MCLYACLCPHGSVCWEIEKNLRHRQGWSPPSLAAPLPQTLQVYRFLWKFALGGQHDSGDSRAPFLCLWNAFQGLVQVSPHVLANLEQRWRLLKQCGHPTRSTKKPSLLVLHCTGGDTPSKRPRKQQSPSCTELFSRVFRPSGGSQHLKSTAAGSQDLWVGEAAPTGLVLHLLQHLRKLRS